MNWLLFDIPTWVNFEKNLLMTDGNGNANDDDGNDDYLVVTKRPNISTESLLSILQYEVSMGPQSTLCLLAWANFFCFTG